VGLEKIFSAVPAIGFISHAQVFGDAAAAGKILAPAKTMAEMHRVIVNDYVDATMCALFVMVVLAMIVFGVIAIRRAFGDPKITAIEIGVPATI
jgi:carbon starvation protein